jgi:hypothetical protein
MACQVPAVIGTPASKVIAHQAVDVLRNAVGAQAAHRPYQR